MIEPKVPLFQEKWIKVQIVGFFLLAPFFMLLISPDVETKASICPSQVLWGVRCVGCGLGKSIAFFEHGYFAKSFAHHPFGGIALIVLIALFIKWLLEALSYSFPINRAFQQVVFYLFVASLVGFHVYRTALDIQEYGWEYGQHGLMGKLLKAELFD